MQVSDLCNTTLLAAFTPEFTCLLLSWSIVCTCKLVRSAGLGVRQNLYSDYCCMASGGSVTCKHVERFRTGTDSRVPALDQLDLEICTNIEKS